MSTSVYIPGVSKIGRRTSCCVSSTHKTEDKISFERGPEMLRSTQAAILYLSLDNCCHLNASFNYAVTKDFLFKI